MPASTSPDPLKPQGNLEQMVVLTGNPNAGKTTVFNALTGLRARVGNYAGVTVERKEGRLRETQQNITVLDLPGAYSLSPQSLDEQIARDVLFHRLHEVQAPAVVVVVVDAANLQRNLYFATQVIELGYPTVVALNMIDVAEGNGCKVDSASLAKALGVPVVPLSASQGQGIEALRTAILQALQPKDPPTAPRFFCELPEIFGQEATAIASQLRSQTPDAKYQSLSEALLLLSDDRALESAPAPIQQTARPLVIEARKRLESSGVDWRSSAIAARYARIAAIEQMVVTLSEVPSQTFTDRLDAIVTHRFWGVGIFIALMTAMFQSIFTLAAVPADALESWINAAGAWTAGRMPAGPLSELIQLGVFAGVGAVVVFLPQICLLFLFIGLLEDTGYMARAAFLMDRLMSKVGLHGKSFIPMLSSFACAIPGIMATRTIESPKDRLVTILVAPLMSCSARLPVYTLLIAACIPNITLLAIFKLPGLVMLGMYLLGIVVALLMAWLFKKTLLKGPTPMLILELPPYKRPVLKTVLRNMWERSKLFLRRAGTVILGINILLWFLATYPKDPAVHAGFDSRRAEARAMPGDTPALEEARAAALDSIDKEEAGEQLRRSYAGRMGHLIEPVIAPLGFDWKIGIGIVASFAAREVFVSTMSMVYNVGGEAPEDEGGVRNLAGVLQAQKTAEGLTLYRPRVGITLMVFYVFALQCVSTVAVVRRETNSWKWPVFQWVYMGVLAWVLAFIAYHICPLFGLN